MTIFLLIIAMVGVLLYIVGLMQSVSYKDYINAQIQREGGLTQQAMANIETYGEEQYGSKFKVISESGSDKKPYGESVNYRIEGRVGGDVANAPSSFIRSKGSSISKVR